MFSLADSAHGARSAIALLPCDVCGEAGRRRKSSGRAARSESRGGRRPHHTRNRVGWRSAARLESVQLCSARRPARISQIGRSTAAWLIDT